MDIEPKSDECAVLAPDLSLCHTIFDRSPLPIAVVAEAEHIVRYVNRAFCHLTGSNKDQLIGKPLREILPDDGCLASLDRIYRTGEAETHAEPEHSDAHVQFWSYAMWPVPGPNNCPVGVTILVTETARFHQQAIAMNQELLVSGLRQHELAEMAGKLNTQLQLEMTERKRMEHALLNSEKLAATARLASTMSHEINNPLGAITNLIYLLGPLQTNPAARSYVAMLDDQVKGLTRIATQMLKFHRDNNQPAEFKLAEALRETLGFYRPQVEKQGIVFVERFETEGTVVGFRGEIIQVVTNLLLNAIEATPVGGKVVVHLYPAPSWLCERHDRCGYCLSVADTGSGIAPQHLSRVFEPFFTTKGDKGTGLGLWLCAGIVSRVGGSIRLWSSRLSRSGTCLSVFLPANAATFTPLRRRYERCSPPAI